MLDQSRIALFGSSVYATHKFSKLSHWPSSCQASSETTVSEPSRATQLVESHTSARVVHLWLLRACYVKYFAWRGKKAFCNSSSACWGQPQTATKTGQQKLDASLGDREASDKEKPNRTQSGESEESVGVISQGSCDDKEILLASPAQHWWTFLFMLRIYVTFFIFKHFKIFHRLHADF